MLNCSFIGHDQIFDTDLRRDINETLLKILMLDTEINFLFSRNNTRGEFEICSIEEIMRLKIQYPSVSIYLTIVLDDFDDYDELSKPYYQALPLCVFDRVIIAPVKTVNDAEDLVTGKRLRRWIIRNSDVLISYRYELLENMNQFDSAIAKNSNMIIYDLTRESTRQYIHDSLPRLTDRQRFVILEIMNGQLLRKISADLHCSQNNIRSIQFYAYRDMQKLASIRMRYEMSGPLQPIICGVILAEFNKPILKMLIAFSEFLKAKKGPVKFAFLAGYTSSKDFECLEWLKENNPHVGFIAITLFDAASSCQQDGALLSYCDEVMTLRPDSKNKPALMASLDYLVGKNLSAIDVRNIRAKYLRPDHIPVIIDFGHLPEGPFQADTPFV